MSKHVSDEAFHLVIDLPDQVAGLPATTDAQSLTCAFTKTKP